MTGAPCVVVRELGRRPAAAVVLPRDDERLGRRATVLIDHKLLYCAVAAEDEAHYLAAMINATPMQDLLASFSNVVGVAPGTLARLPIPPYDPAAGGRARRCREGRRRRRRGRGGARRRRGSPAARGSFKTVTELRLDDGRTLRVHDSGAGSERWCGTTGRPRPARRWRRARGHRGARAAAGLLRAPELRRVEPAAGSQRGGRGARRRAARRRARARALRDGRRVGRRAARAGLRGAAGRARQRASCASGRSRPTPRPSTGSRAWSRRAGCAARATAARPGRRSPRPTSSTRTASRPPTGRRWRAAGQRWARTRCGRARRAWTGWSTTTSRSRSRGGSSSPRSARRSCSRTASRTAWCRTRTRSTCCARSRSAELWLRRNDGHVSALDTIPLALDWLSTIR